MSGDSNNLPKKNVALITGITGQDGSYLAEFLLEKGYEVHGVIRRSSSFNTGRIQHLYGQPATHSGGRMHLHYGDMTDTTCLISIVSKNEYGMNHQFLADKMQPLCLKAQIPWSNKIEKFKSKCEDQNKTIQSLNEKVKPTEIYNLAAQSHVKVSFELSEYTAEVDGIGPLRLLEAVRVAGLERRTRIYQASTSELYGKVQEVPQTEKTPFYPRSPYSCAKIYGYWIVSTYRESYGMFACNGLLFNHESPRRGENFVTRKITRGVAKITLGLMDCLELGNLNSTRDWGHAKDYIEAMWLMLQQDTPEDFVVATGEGHSVREFVEKAFSCVGREIEWRGEGVNETGHDKGTGQLLVKVNPKYFRPNEVDQLLGDSTKIRQKLGWRPRVTFHQLVEEMVRADLALMRSNPEA